MKKSILITIQPKSVEKILNGEKTIEIRKSMPKCDLPIDVYVYCSKGRGSDKNPSLCVMSNLDYDKKTQEFILKGQEYGLNVWKDLVPHFGILDGKVVAKFTLNKVEHYQTAYVTPNNNSLYNFTKYGLFIKDDFIYSNDGWLKNEQVEDLSNKSCLNIEDIHTYAKTGKLEDLDYGNFYAWHIENLQIFDKPMELNQFEKYYDEPDDLKSCCNGKHCKHESYDWCENQSCCDIDYDGTDCPYLKVNKAPQSWQYVYVED